MLEARREWLAIADVPVRPPARWDTHPPTAERLWALDYAPDTWEDYPRESTLARLKVDAEAAYRAIARASKQPVALLALPGADIPEDGLAAAITLAACDEGSIRFAHRWDEEPDFAYPNGSTVDLAGHVEDLLSEWRHGAGHTA
ncbi:hypothetical protein [Amycolatopsis sp. NPDC051071]|uniref:hypothetical protein n=1 Tax=Amycolatopsis sp. NPDC051071 TaxID=3154637 RepID=UPI0034382910